MPEVVRYSGTGFQAPITVLDEVGVAVVTINTTSGVRIGKTGGKVGFYGTAPAALSAAYTPTNVTPDRSYDADSTSTAELADVLGTLIADLQLLGLIG